MKRTPLAVGIACAVALFSCATVKQNIDARALLASCKYEYAGIAVTGVNFAEGLEIESVNFDVKIRITNTVDRDIALDHAELSLFLDANRVLDLGHKRFARVVPAASAVESVSVGVPFSGIARSLGHKPEKIGVKAKLWVTLLVGKETWETPIAIAADVEMPIPYDQIEAFVAAKKKELEAEAAAKAREEAKKLVPSIELPKF
jgi:hypothetical protein